MNTQNRNIYAKMKRDYTHLAMIYARKLPKINNSVDLRFTWIRKNRRTDPDNITAGTKFILDAIVNAGKIENDGWKQINSIKHNFEVDKDNPRVEINIKELSK